MALRSIATSFALGTALLYATNAYAQNSDKAVTAKPVQAAITNTQFAGAGIDGLYSDPDFLNVFGEINLLQYRTKRMQNRSIDDAASPAKIGETLSSSIKQLIDRFDFKRNYFIKGAFTHGEQIIVGIGYPESEKISAYEDFVVLSPLNAKFSELESREVTQGIASNKEIRQYRSGKFIEQALLPKTYDKQSTRKIDPAGQNKPRRLNEILREVGLIESSRLIPPHIPDDFDFSQVRKLYEEHGVKEMYLSEKIRELSGEISHACGLEYLTAFSFSTLSRGALKLNLSTQVFAGDASTRMFNGDALYISSDKTGTLVRTNFLSGRIEVKQTKCNFAD